MKREVLFHGKRVDNGMWIEGSLWVNLGTPKIISAANAVGYDVVPETVGQFIGRTDKNSKKIFEDDVVKTKTGRLCVVCWFSSPSFCGWDLKPVNTAENTLRTPAPPAYDLYLQENLEVVGNIHDNTELIC